MTTKGTRYSFRDERKEAVSTRETAAVKPAGRRPRKERMPTVQFEPHAEPVQKAGGEQPGSLEETTGEEAKERKKPGRGTLVPKGKQIKKEIADIKEVEEAVRSAIPARFPKLSGKEREKLVDELAKAKKKADGITDRSPKQEFVASFVSPDLVELVLEQYLKFDKPDKQKVEKAPEAATG